MKDHGQDTRRIPSGQRFFLFFLTLVGLVSCSEGEVSRRGPVDAQGPDRPLSWEISEQRVLARPTGGSPGWFAGLHPALVAGSSRGYVYVLDDVSGTVVSFDPDGNFVQRWGRRGGGPGEFSAPVAIGIEGDTVLIVYDLAKRALVRLRSDGAPLAERQIDGAYAGGPLLVGSNGVIMASVSVVRGKGILRTTLTFADSTARRPLLVHDRPLPRGLVFPGCPTPLPISKRFQPVLVWGGSGTRSAAVADARYVVTVWDGSSTALTIGRPMRAAVASRDWAMQDLRDDPLGRRAIADCGVDAEQLLTLVGYADELQIVQRIAVTPNGEIWVTVLSRSGIATDVFSPHGGYVGTLTADVPLIASFIDDSTFTAIVESDSGHRVGLYRIRRG